VDYLMEVVGGWIDAFDIDGIRLDVAYLLDAGFMQRLRAFTDGKKKDFFLVGEMLHGDYKAIVRSDMLHSATNYECYKGLYSSFNSSNLFEIGYSLNRQFGPENWTLYRGLPLLNFADNHDVPRIASLLENKRHLPLLYGVLFAMPGVPCLYYGSEWGAEGDKTKGDAALRPAFDAPVENALFDCVAQLAKIRSEAAALENGAYRQVYLTNTQLIFERKADGQRLLVAVNIEEAAHVAHFDAAAGTAKDLLSGKMVDFGGGFTMPGLSVQYLKMEK
jgi:glycosidase